MPARPDLAAALVVRTVQLTETNALIVGRVSARLKLFDAKNEPNGWKLPDYAIVWRKVPGPVPQRAGTVPLTSTTMQYECYGKDLRTADLLARTLLAELFPDPPAASGFIAAHCAVTKLQEMSSPYPSIDPDRSLPRSIGTLLVEYCERPV